MLEVGERVRFQRLGGGFKHKERKDGERGLRTAWGSDIHVACLEEDVPQSSSVGLP